MGLAIRSAIEEGVEEYDMLPGDEQYKFLWTRGARELGRVELYPLRLRGAVCKATVGLSRTAKRLTLRVTKGVQEGECSTRRRASSDAVGSEASDSGWPSGRSLKSVRSGPPDGFHPCRTACWILSVLCSLCRCTRCRDSQGMD
ncbi:MAG: hypothetical protein DMG05_30410 [Acidobacteria bacterium]|nr:MAG: hypothetical protein DMG05_30410 [Acidobacteriota bacterium]